MIASVPNLSILFTSKINIIMAERLNLCLSRYYSSGQEVLLMCFCLFAFFPLIILISS